MKKGVIVLLSLLLLCAAGQVSASYAGARDPGLEQRLDTILGINLLARDREALSLVLRALNDQTPTATLARAKAYQALAQAIQDNEPAAALALLDALSNEPEIAQDPHALAELSNARGEIYLHTQNRDALRHYLGELKDQSIAEPKLYFHRLHLIARSYDLLHDYEQALTYLLRAHEMVASIQDEQQQRRRQFINLHIGRTYARLRHFDSARQSLDKTIAESNRLGVTEYLPELHMVRGFVIQVTEGPNAAAEADFLKATTPVRGEPVGRTQMLAFNNLGTLKLHTGQYAAAEQYFSQGIEIAHQIDNSFELHIMRFNQGYVMVKQGGYEQGLSIMEAAFADFSQVAPPGTQADMLNYLADAYETAQRLERALGVLRQQLELRETAHRAERERTLAELQVQHDAQEASLRIQLLEQESALREAKIAEQQRNQYWVILLSSILFVALALSLFAARYVRQLNRQLSKANQELTELSHRDPLTQLYNRRALAGFSEQHGDLLVLFDLDKFKGINDQFGHDVGDQVLQSVSQRVKAVLRKEDLLVRWGGEEFLVVIRRINELGLDVIKAKLHSAIVHSPFADITVNASGGAVFLQGQTSTWQSAIKRADELLYQAKANGRARILLEHNGEVQTWQMREAPPENS